MVLSTANSFSTSLSSKHPEFSTRFRSPNTIALKSLLSSMELKRSSGSVLDACKVGRRICASAAPVLDQTVSKAPTIVEVDLGNRSYLIYIGSGLLDQPNLLQRHVHGKRVIVVTNNTVAPLYLDKVTDALTRGNRNVSVENVILPDGEKYKDMGTLMKVFDKAIESRLDRRCTFVALGDGVIGVTCVVMPQPPTFEVLISFKFLQLLWHSY